MPTLTIKVVTGAKRDRVVGRLGDALKVCVAAPPEDGKANAAVVALLAETLGVRPNQVAVVQGHARPRKVVQVEGMLQADVDARIAAITRPRLPSPD